MSLELELGKRPKSIEMPPLPAEEPIMESVYENTSEPVAQEAASQGEDTQEENQATSQQILQQAEAPRETIRPEVPQQEAAQAKNFRELRNKAETAQRERDDFEKRYRELELKVAQKDDFNLSPDDLVEGKHIAQLVKEQREMKQKLQQYEQQNAQQRQMAQAEANLRAHYNDFDRVVNESTITALKEKYPQKAEAIAKLAHDPESAFDYAYMTIKMNNLAPSDAPHPTTGRQDADSAKAQQNSIKPRPLNTVSAQHTDSPISRMNAFANGEVTKDIQKQLWKEMNDARKGY
jgi:hypothetical protein